MPDYGAMTTTDTNTNETKTKKNCMWTTRNWHWPTNEKLFCLCMIFQLCVANRRDSFFSLSLSFDLVRFHFLCFVTLATCSFKCTFCRSEYTLSIGRPSVPFHVFAFFSSSNTSDALEHAYGRVAWRWRATNTSSIETSGGRGMKRKYSSRARVLARSLVNTFLMWPFNAWSIAILNHSFGSLCNDSESDTRYHAQPLFPLSFVCHTECATDWTVRWGMNYTFANVPHFFPSLTPPLSIFLSTSHHFSLFLAHLPPPPLWRSIFRFVAPI